MLDVQENCRTLKEFEGDKKVKNIKQERIRYEYPPELYFYDKKSVCINRVCFWLAIAFTPLIEIALKIPFSYHYANLLPGLAGLTAIGWKYMSNQESKKINLSFTMLIGLMSLFVVLPKVSQAIIKNPYILN